ncbi:PPOX class F420-dependent oxidoreductase [Tsukamurella tyrosinosolvens]|uniref:Pyridoxamine 5'-phosphate oxidase N-terminal domain-containing protein n=1 Tax=Tsukamurella tyrosinosolvens TaxID=57704 RepID=A0A1H4LYR9_TSUTY|nr:PPOX class F420-dependent oxidoreductase [Tsukamurella tyrosinosolvens]AUN39044.1 PPOX class F420-dependent enzyme [Tsukamurella tyrosinosolvens]KXO96759.1 F420-dependent protein [Tsukamurella tyrosinosolvens]KXP02302.1 F420-dependent protein [Tsukamurella tyrosinosolvens]KZL96440.1 F420-dependent protein [Tsukamurella tyrosinosolvens]MCA4996318.1 PPOX class F420-dependent oxidoreductase [Tsukamurella tyrosinosolvens]
MTTVADVADAKYVLLTTFRKDGTPVATPIWAVRDGADLVVWTVADSWKVKRLRRNPSVLVQACDARGKKTTGPEVAGTGEVVDGGEAGSKIAKKYGVLGWLTVTGSKLRRGADGTVGIRVRDAA